MRTVERTDVVISVENYIKNKKHHINFQRCRVYHGFKYQVDEVIVVFFSDDSLIEHINEMQIIYKNILIYHTLNHSVYRHFRKILDDVVNDTVVEIQNKFIEENLDDNRLSERKQLVFDDFKETDDKKSKTKKELKKKLENKSKQKSKLEMQGELFANFGDCENVKQDPNAKIEIPGPKKNRKKRY